jgi:spore photoproduct lyase
MVIYDGCHEDYRRTVGQIFAHVSPENIVWISLGSFRFPPDLKPIIETRFADSKIVYGEFISGLDGKMRYFKPLRIDLYRRIVDAIRAHAPDVLIYFCMEDDAVWRKTFGFVPQERGGLPQMLDEASMRVCGLLENNRAKT